MLDACQEQPRARYQLPLSREALSASGIGEVGARIADAVVRIVDEGHYRCAERLLLVWDAYAQIRVTPVTAESSAVCLYLYGDGDVGIEAGEGIFFTVLDDLRKPATLDVPGYVGAIVAAIVAGKLRETVYYFGHVACRWAFGLSLDSERIELERLDLGRLLRSFWKRRTKKTIVYAPYTREDG